MIEFRTGRKGRVGGRGGAGRAGWQGKAEREAGFKRNIQGSGYPGRRQVRAVTKSRCESPVSWCPSAWLAGCMLFSPHQFSPYSTLLHPYSNAIATSPSLLSSTTLSPSWPLTVFSSLFSPVQPHHSIQHSFVNHLNLPFASSTTLSPSWRLNPPSPNPLTVSSCLSPHYSNLISLCSPSFIPFLTPSVSWPLHLFCPNLHPRLAVPTPSSFSSSFLT